MHLRRVLVAGLTLLVVAAVLAGLVTGVLGQLLRTGLYATGLRSDGAASTLAPGTLGTPADGSPGTSTSSTTPTPSGLSAVPSTQAARLPDPVLQPAGRAKAPDSDRLDRRIDAVDDAGVRGRVSAEVLDVGSGRAVYRDGAARRATPASTMKLLTAASVLSLLPPEHRFRTTVVRAGTGRIVLVGGGDPYLTAKATASRYPERASLGDLAIRTARALAAGGTTTVRLSYDTSLFSGPAWNPAWPASYGDQVTPTSALWVDEGRVRGSPGPRVADPPKSAAAAFATALRTAGIRVQSVTAGTAPARARELAAVQSMPLERIVEQLLFASDNDASEVILRHAGLAGRRSGSIEGGVTAVRRQLTELGAWSKGMVITDGSGLARETAVPASSLTAVLGLAASKRRPELRALLTGLPVAGVEGSLRSRFFDDESLPGRGVVRGKTGTLRKVHSLAGAVRTRDGSLLVFAFLVNDPPNDFAARVWLDRVTTAIGRCGCR